MMQSFHNTHVKLFNILFFKLFNHLTIQPNKLNKLKQPNKPNEPTIPFPLRL